MIVPMRKVFVAARTRDRDRLLETIRDMGAMHLVPTDPARVADEQASARIQAAERAAQVLSGVAPAGAVPEIPPQQAAVEVLEIQRRSVEKRNRLVTLYHQLEQIAVWGDLDLKQIDALRAAGVDVHWYSVPRRVVPSIQAECVEAVGELPGKRALVAVIDRRGEARLPDEAIPVPLPVRDAPSIRAEAAQLDAAIHADAARLSELAGLLGPLRRELVHLRQEAEYAAAQRGALGQEHLFAVQGWLPAESAEALPAVLQQSGITAAVEQLAPEPDEEPPTLVRPPRWARPVEGLFKMLGTVAGYREFDVSVPFLIALPIFTAILISDGGYGAVLLLGLLLFYRKAAGLLGSSFTHMLLIISVAALAWGVLVGSFFGFVLYRPWIPVDLSEQSRDLMMRMSFLMGAVHLSIAQLWPAVRFFPDLRFLGKVGWAIFIWGMYGVVHKFVLRGALGWDTPWPYLLLSGAALAIVFHRPGRNVAAMLLHGLGAFPLSMLSAFSDVISYVRLMAVGLASGVLATSFNDMARGLDAWPLAVAVFVFGHSLNIGLAMIAMFAHGVRLNMLEFCNNLGMQWTGYPYHPFLKRTTLE